MKKLLAILIAAFMLFSMVACDTGDDPNPSGSDNPGTTQNGGEKDPDTQEGEDETGTQGTQGGNISFTGYEWPVTDYLTAGMRWTGSGIVVKRSETTDTYRDTGIEYKKYTIYVETATLDEVGTYLAALKNEGFIYYTKYTDTDEPALEFNSSKMYKWEGEASDGRAIQITLYSSELNRGGYDMEANREYTYKLEIVAYSVSPYTEPNSYVGN